MKVLIEKRAKLMAELDEHLADETRLMNQEELDVVNAKMKEVKEIDAQIEQAKEIRNLKNTKDMKVDGEKDMELREQLLNGTEVEVRDMTKANVAGEKVSNGELVKERVKENGILNFARIVPVNGKSIVPVQKTKMGKLVKAGELAEIAKKDIEVGQVDLRPEKYACLTVVSEELVNDNSYDVEQLIREEGRQAIEETVAGLMVTGDATAFGLEKATTSNGCIEVTRGEEGTLSLEDINALYFGLKAKYRKNAIFIVNDEHLKALLSLVGNDGQPILQRDLTQEFGYKLLGRPVVIAEDATKMYFVDMEQAMVAGVGTNAQVKRSDDAYFISGGIAFRTMTAIDVKQCIGNALAFMA